MIKILVNRHWFAITSGVMCFAWAFAAWLAVDPNQDILADGIQAQSILADPRIVLSFPGQKHGGPLEYPYTLLAEWIAPGNFYVNAAIRPILAFLTGFFAAKLFKQLYPQSTHWAFLVAVATGPVIVHGYIGPRNAVGVWWLQPNWDMAWLLVTVGLYLFARNRTKNIGPLFAGVLVGLGFFAHPAVIILIIPLTTLTLLVTKLKFRELLLAALGFCLGIFPAVVSYFVNDEVNTWDPSHGLFISFEWYWDMGRTVLGLSGIPDHMMAILPYAAGLSPDQTFLSGPVQSVLIWVLVALIFVFSVTGTIKAIQERRWLSQPTNLALAWLALIVTLFAFITAVDQVWLYSASLAILYWISVGALPHMFTNRTIGILVTVLILMIATISTITHNRFYVTGYWDLVEKKAELQSQYQSTAQVLEKQGVEFIFGGYLTVIPIAYASGYDLRVITQTYNRFPVTSEELQRESVRVAVEIESTDRSGTRALDLARQSCVPVPQAAIVDGFEIFDCPPSVLVVNETNAASDN